MTYVFVLGAVLCVAFWMLLHSLRKDTLLRGSAEEQNKTIAGGLEDVQKIHDARNDPAALQRVRDKYQRD